MRSQRMLSSSWRFLVALVVASAVVGCGRDGLQRGPAAEGWDTDPTATGEAWRPGEIDEQDPDDLPDGELIGLTISPDKVELPRGGERNVTLEALFEGGARADVTGRATWELLEGQGIARLEGYRVFAEGPGEATLEARWRGQRATAPVTVSDRQLESLRIAPERAEVRPGGTLRLAAWGRWADTGNEEELTELASWSVDDERVAQVSNAVDREGEALGVTPGRVEVTARIGQVEARAQLDVVASAELRALVISPPSAELLVGAAEQFTVFGLYSDGTRSELTREVELRAQPQGIVELGANGALEAAAPGVAELIASTRGLEARAPIEVLEAAPTELRVSPLNADTGVGGQVQFEAWATLDDGTLYDATRHVSWGTSNSTIASIDQRGLARARGPGFVTLIAALGQLEATGIMVVRDAAITELIIEPPEPTGAPGVTQPLHAMARYTDGSVAEVSAEADWSSSNTLVAEVDERGELLGREPGTAVVLAELGGMEARASVTITDAPLTELAITPSDVWLGPGQRARLRAEATYGDGTQLDVSESVTWLSSDPSVGASNRDGERGEITAISRGGATITAVLGEHSAQALVTVGETRLERIELEPAEVSVPLGARAQLEATGHYVDGTEREITAQATWRSANPLLVDARNTPGERGQVVGRGAGTVEVIASLDGVEARASVQVRDVQLEALEIEPAPVPLQVGQTVELEAVGVYSDGERWPITELASWSTTAPEIALVQNAAAWRGHIQGRSPGTAQVRARVGAIIAQADVEVSGARINRLVVTPRESVTVVGLERQFTARAILEDGSGRNVTALADWSTGDAGTATINDLGVVTAQGQGQTEIAARWRGFEASVTMRTRATELVELQVTPTTPQVARETLMRFWATAIYSDGTREDVSESVDWSTDDPAVITITRRQRWAGIAIAQGAGTANILAKYRGIEGSTQVTVTDAQIAEIKVTPVHVSVAPGTELQYFAQAVYTDGTSRDITWACNWTASDYDIADVIDDDWEVRGQVVARRPGTAVISATYQGVSGDATLEVTEAEISHIQVVPFSPTINQGDQIRFWATAVFNDGTTQQVTTEALWQVQDPTIATASNSRWREGLVTTHAPGKTEVLATYDGVTGRADLEVTGLQITQIQVTPFLEQIPTGYYLRMLATAIYDNGTSRDVTGLATWTSTNPMVADVHASFWVKGIALGLSPGTSFIEARYQGVSGSAELTVTDATLAEIRIEPADETIQPGEVAEFEATGVFSDGTEREVTHYVTWSSTDQSVGDISNAWASRGEATGFSPGQTTIQAAQGMIRGVATLTVEQP